MKNNSKYIFYFFPILVWAIVYFGLSFDGLYGQDAYEYLRYTEALKVFFTTGKNPGDYFWGIYYPIFGSILSFIIPNTALALQQISVFSLVITSLYVDKIIGLIYKENASQNITFLIFTLSPIVLIHSVLAMSDLLSCCFVTIAFYSFLQFLEIPKNKHFLIGIAFCFLAILIRYVAVLVVLPICTVALFRLLKNRNYKLILFSIPIVLIIAIPHLLVRSQNSLQFLSHQWLQSWNVFNLFQSNFATVDGEMNNHFINLIYVCFSFVHPIFIFSGVIIIGFFAKRRPFKLIYYQKIIVVTIIAYALFLGGIPYQNKRYLILSFPLVIAFIFPLAKKLLITLKHRKLVIVLIVYIQISLGIYFGKSFYDRNLLEKKITQKMNQYQGRTLYVFDVDIAMKGRKLKFDYKNLWASKYLSFEKNALVLVNEKQLGKQWKGKNPLLNWENIKNNYLLEKLENFSGDFNLYRIDGKK